MIDTFTQAYVDCALWSTNDESTPEGGEPLDDNYTIDDLAPECLETIKADCKRFQEENADDIAGGYNIESQWSDDEHAGHDFWLTRNGHGAGFWDGDWPEGSDTRLTKASEAFGEVDLYIGDDGLIYC